MRKLVRIFAAGCAATLALSGAASALERAHHVQVRDEAGIVGALSFAPELLLVQDRPPLDGVINSLRTRYGAGEVKSVSDIFVGRDGRDYFTVKYLTNDGQMIIVRVDARTGQIVGGR